MNDELAGLEGASVATTARLVADENRISSSECFTRPEDGYGNGAAGAGKSKGVRSTGLTRLLMNMIPPRLLGLYRVVRRGRNAVPPVGGVRFGSFQLRPFSRWGYGRGTPIDRSYIDRFLAASRIAITGDVLEFGDAKYTQRFGGDDVRSHVLHVSDGNPAATIVADITQPEALAADAFDCIVCTQTLQQLYDVPAAIRNLHRSLRPGGALLATVPCISQIDRSAADRWGDFWRFTPLSIRRLFCESFSEDDVTVSSYGNVLASTAFLYGVAAEELDPEDLDRADADYPMLIAIRAGKPAR